MKKGTSEAGATAPIMRFYLDHRSVTDSTNTRSTQCRHPIQFITISYQTWEGQEREAKDVHQRADRACGASHCTAQSIRERNPGDEELSTFLNSPSLINCEVTALDLRNVRELQGPCPIHLQVKPLPVTGSYPTYGRDNERQPGEHIRGDIIFVWKVPIAMDARSRHYTVVHLINQSCWYLFL